MNEEKIEQAIFKLLKRIAPESEPSHLSPDENIRRALDIDSFDALNFFIQLNEQLGVEIPESDYGLLNTLAEMRRYLADRLS
ncbi:MAG: acyl carrier protein [Desulfobacterales bacterium]|nr:acyl carrier protein [Desulfobacterales bacterium]